MSENKLYTEQRRADILNLIRQMHAVSVGALAEQFEVSGTTIRLDLKALENKGLLQRTHGGAMLNEQSLREPLISERLHEKEKADIATLAASKIEDGDVMLIDTGTTATALARALVRTSLRDLVIYSNDLTVLQLLEEKKDWKLILLGGRVRNGFHYTFGYDAIRLLRQLHFKKLFLAASAISFREGLTTSDSELVHIKTAMIKSAETVCLLADSSKLHRVAFQRFAELSEVDNLITDKGVSPGDLEELKERIRIVETAG